MAERGHRNSGVTATDVARRAGVSQSTVSRVLNPNGKVKVQEEARQRVLQAARELGYRPNAIAQTMISGRSKIVGVVVSDYFNVFYYQMLQLLTNRLMAAGLQAMVFSSPPRSDINELLQRFYRYQVDGVIVTSSALSHHVTEQGIQRGVPVVLINGYLPDMGVNAVQSDQFGSGILMADYLVGVGHRRFAYVSSENSPHRNYMPRQEGFLEGLRRHGVDTCRVIPGGYSYQSGLEVGESLAREADMPDAIFCSGDWNAMGVLDALRRHSQREIGREVSVTGYDTPILTGLEAYSITGLTQDMDGLCSDAVELLETLMEDPERPPQLLTRPMHLTIRSSSRPLPREMERKKG